MRTLRFTITDRNGRPSITTTNPLLADLMVSQGWTVTNVEVVR